MGADLPLNEAMVTARLNDIRDQLRVLRAHACTEDGAFLANAEGIRSARYALIVLVEAAAAICNHLCARRLRETPETYADCFRRMAAGGLLDRGLAARLGAMARLRNLLVHVYAQVDDARLLRALREDLGDVEAYAQTVEGLLAAEGGGS